jgi:hypothetical protein
MIDIVFSNVGGPSAGLGAAAFGSENRSEITVMLKKDKQKEEVLSVEDDVKVRNEE